MTQVAVLAVPGCLHSAVNGIGEILAHANVLHGAPLFEHKVVTPDGAPVMSFTGTTVSPGSALRDAGPDVLVLPPLFGAVEDIIALEGVIQWLEEFHAKGGLVASICAGAFLLAETGMLDGRNATTHWALAEKFRDRYPLVRLQIERLLVDGGDYVCAGGVSAWMDLGLWLVAKYAGREVSLACAKTMLMDPHREYQTPYGMGGFRRNHGDVAVLRAQMWMEEHYAEAPRLRDLAREAVLGERTFLRRFRAATGQTPVQYMRMVRVDAAQTLLETTGMGMEAVAEAVGYADYSAFRKLFNETMGTTPSAYRRRFAP